MKTPRKKHTRAKLGRPRIRFTHDVEFQVQLQAYADALGGAARVAEISQTSKRAIQLWLSGKGNPAYATKLGVLGLLAMSALTWRTTSR